MLMVDPWCTGEWIRPDEGPARRLIRPLLFLHTPLTKIKGIGPRSEEILHKAGIRCVEDLKKWVQNHKEPDFTFKVHHRKALAKRLFARFKI